MNEWEDKVWGKTRVMFTSGSRSVCELETVSNSYCSIHYHQSRSNHFTVNNGHIVVAKFMGPHVITQHLHPGMSMIIDSCIPHMFISLVDSHVIETYRSIDEHPVDMSDITRLTVGGLFSGPYKKLIENLFTAAFVGPTFL